MVDLLVSVLRGERESGYVIVKRTRWLVVDTECALSLVREALRRIDGGEPACYLLTAELDDGWGVARIQTRFGIVQIYCNYSLKQGAPPQYVHVWLIKS